MLGVTLFGIFLTPVFFYVIQWLKDLRPIPPPEPEEDEEPLLAHGHSPADPHHGAIQA
jgi:hypothetical protein